MHSCRHPDCSQRAFAAPLVEGLVGVMRVFASDGSVSFGPSLVGSTMDRMAVLGFEKAPT